MNNSAAATVLLVTDGSPDARAAEALLAGVNWPAGSAAMVLATLPQQWSLLESGLDTYCEVRDILVCLERRARGAAEAIGRESAWRLSLAGLITMMVVREGDPAQVVLDLMAEAQPSLVALGAKGVDRASALRLGPTALEVLLAAQTSVLVARAARRSPPARVIVAADGLMDWLGPDGWPLALLPAGAEVTLAKLSSAAEAPGDSEAADLCAVEFGELLQAHGLAVRNMFPHGEPRAALVRLARATEADLVIVGNVSAAAAGGAARPLGLSVAKYAPCSVLVVQPSHTGVTQASPASEFARLVRVPIVSA